MASAPYDDEHFALEMLTVEIENMSRKKLNKKAIELYEQIVALGEYNEKVRHSELAARQLSLAMLDWFKSAVVHRDMLHTALKDVAGLLREGKAAQALSILSIPEDMALPDPTPLIDATMELFSVDDQTVADTKEIAEGIALRNRLQSEADKSRFHLVNTVQIAHACMERGMNDKAMELLREVSALFPPLKIDEAA